jgi:hypothetical protein
VVWEGGAVRSLAIPIGLSRYAADNTL